MKHLVIIGLVIPKPASTAAGHRMMQLIEIFRDKGYKITFLTSANNLEFSGKMEIQKIELNDSSFDELIQKLNPDLILFDRYVSEEQFGWRVSEQCPKAVKILDTEDLHFLREARHQAFKEKRDFENQDLLNDIFKREFASILRCDISLIISDFEMNLLQNQFNIVPEILFYLPFLTEKMPQKAASFQERKHFVSIGNFLHEPNWQTVIQLKKIWTTIRKQLPKTELHIYGAYASEKVFQFHNEKDGFIVKGRAESVENIFNEYRVLLAPIPFGAGLKGKLWESMKFGIPNVTSTIGAEGMHGNLPWNGFIEDNEGQFIQKSVVLYSDEKAWIAVQKNGFEILEKRFKKEGFVPLFFDKINSILQDVQHHRNNNFLGQIFQHHQLNATKYMSKWIEEKNKK